MAKKAPESKKVSRSFRLPYDVIELIESDVNIVPGLNDTKTVTDALKHFFALPAEERHKHYHGAASDPSVLEAMKKADAERERPPQATAAPKRHVGEG